MFQGRTGALLRHAPALLGVALLVGALYVVQRELSSLRLDDVLHAMGAIPLSSLALAFAITVIAYLVLTLYDMLKAIDRGMTIEQIALQEKHGGKSGDYVR